MSAAPAPPPGRRRSRTGLLLALSLGLNLALAGLVAGLVLGGHSDSRRAGPSHLHYALSLPDPYRQEIRRSLRASRGDWEEPRARLAGQRAAFAAALVADPFEIEAVAAVLAQEADLARTLSQRGTGMLLDQVARMPPGDRAIYAANVLERSRTNRR